MPGSGVGVGVTLRGLLPMGAGRIPAELAEKTTGSSAWKAGLLHSACGTGNKTLQETVVYKQHTSGTPGQTLVVTGYLVIPCGGP